MTDDYWLGNSSWVSTRLRLQYELTLTNFDRHLLDPSIPIPSSSEPSIVADIATGTGVWALSLAEQHPNVTIEGLDINLNEVPPKDWLPSNVSFHNFNLLEDIPSHLVERYDIIHIQYVMVFVLDHNIDQVLDRLISILKPGGYIQWTDSNRNKYSWRTATPGEQPTQVRALFDTARQIFARNESKYNWLDNTDAIFTRHGLQDVKFIAPEPKPSTEQPVMMNWIWALEGLGPLRGKDTPKREMIDQWFQQRDRAVRGIGELKVGMNMKAQRCIGRKAASV